MNLSQTMSGPMMRANARYENDYLLGTSIARPLIAARQVAMAKKLGADAVAHGATGKGNDQVRFELGYLSLAPDIKVIAPWRIWDLNSRSKLVAYAKERGIKVPPKHEKDEVPYSMDANLFHISYEGGELENPDHEPPKDMWRRTVSPKEAPDEAREIEIAFEHGDPVVFDGDLRSGAHMLESLNSAAGEHGIGRLDVVESRYVGMKSRGCYETPGGTLLLFARRALETITLDREVMRLRADLMPRYAAMVYNGYWFSPERKLLQGLFDESQKPVCGSVRCELHKGNIRMLGMYSGNGLYDPGISSFEDDKGAYDQKDAHGFIRLNALRLRMSAMRDGKDKKD